MQKFEEIVKADLFTEKAELEKRYAVGIIEHLLRVRDMYNMVLANPQKRDRDTVNEVCQRYGISKTQAYQDLQYIHTLLPMLSQATKAFHRYRANEMLLQAYEMAEQAEDYREMGRIATAYSKVNRVETEDEQVIPYEDIVVQPFVPTTDPTVLGIKPIKNLKERIAYLLHKYGADNPDIEDIEAEEADL